MIERRWGRIINITGKSEPEHQWRVLVPRPRIHQLGQIRPEPHGRPAMASPSTASRPAASTRSRSSATTSPEYRAWQSEHEIPVGRYGEPEEPADLAFPAARGLHHRCRDPGGRRTAPLPVLRRCRRKRPHGMRAPRHRRMPCPEPDPPPRRPRRRAASRQPWVRAQAWPARAIRFLCLSRPAAPARSSRPSPPNSAGSSGRACSWRTSRRRRRHRDAGRRQGGADGHTLILTHAGTMAVNPYMLAKPALRREQGLRTGHPADPRCPTCFVIHPDVPAHDFRSSWPTRTGNPGKLNYDGAGGASASHLAIEYLKAGY